MGQSGSWPVPGKVKKGEIFEGLTSRESWTQDSYLPGFSVIVSTAASQRPDREGTYLHELRNEGGIRSAEHLNPTRLITTLHDIALKSENPISTFQEIINDCDIYKLPEEEYLTRFIDKCGKDIEELEILGKCKEILSGEDEKAVERMKKILAYSRNLVTFFANSGYSFILGPFAIPDFITAGDENTAIRVGGGTCDAIGVRIHENANPKLIDSIRHIQSLKYKHGYFENLEVTISMLLDKYGNDFDLDILETKLQDKDSLGDVVKSKHRKQIKRYINLAGINFPNLNIRGRIIYSGGEVKIDEFKQDKSKVWIKEEVLSASSRRSKDELKIRNGQLNAILKKMVKNPDRVAQELFEKVDKEKRCDLLTLVALSHYQGATLLQDGAIVIPIHFYKALLVRPEKSSEVKLVTVKQLSISAKPWGELRAKDFLRSRWGKRYPLHLSPDEYPTYAQIVAAFNFYGKRTN